MNTETLWKVAEAREQQRLFGVAAEDAARAAIKRRLLRDARIERAKSLVLWLLLIAGLVLIMACPNGGGQ